jgi:hypothetical protein
MLAVLAQRLHGMSVEVLESSLEVSSVMNTEVEAEAEAEAEAAEMEGQINSVNSRCIVRVEGNK